MRIAVNTMGGDHAPREIVKGAVEASRAWPELEILLLGDEGAVRRELSACRAESIYDSRHNIDRVGRVLSDIDRRQIL